MRRRRRTAVLGALAALATAGVAAQGAAAAVTTTYAGNRLGINGDAGVENFEVGCIGNQVYVGSTPASGFVPCDGVEYFDVRLGEGDDTIVLGKVFKGAFRSLRVMQIDMGGGNDTVVGTRIQPPFESTDVKMLVTAGPGNDTIHGGRTGDILYGGPDNDRIDVGDGHHIPHPNLRGIYAGGDDQLHGQDGDDQVSIDFRANMGRDTMTSGCGRDRIGALDLDQPDTIVRNSSTIVVPDPGDIVQFDPCATSTRTLELVMPQKQLFATRWSPMTLANVLLQPQFFKAVLTLPILAPQPTPDPTPPDPPPPPPPPPQCSDGIDNDGDQRIDYGDPNDSFGNFDRGCDSPSDNTEDSDSSPSPRAGASQAAGGATLSLDLSADTSQIRMDVIALGRGVVKRPNRLPCRKATRSRLRSMRKAAQQAVPDRLRGRARRRRLALEIDARSCLRPSRVGTVVQGGLPAGFYKIPFPGSVNGKVLPPGRYMAVVGARDAAGLTVFPTFAGFQVRR